MDVVPASLRLIEYDMSSLLLQPSGAERHEHVGELLRNGSRSAASFTNYSGDPAFYAHDRPLDALDSIGYEARRTNGLLSDIRQGLERIEDLADWGLSELRDQTGLLESLEATAREPYKTKAAEARREAYALFKRGTQRLREGLAKDSEFLFAEALRNFRGSTELPGGSSDAGSWFHIGVLCRHSGHAASAKDAFLRAQILSRETSDALFEHSSTFLAYLHFVSAEYEESYSAMAEALRHRRDVPALHAAAACAAAAGRSDAALEHLREAVRASPTSIVSMFATVVVSESFTAEMVRLMEDLTREQREKALSQLRFLEEALGHERESPTGEPITDGWPDFEAASARALASGYLELLDFNSGRGLRERLVAALGSIDELTASWGELAPDLEVPAPLRAPVSEQNSARRGLLSSSEDIRERCEAVEHLRGALWETLSDHLKKSITYSERWLENHIKRGVTGLAPVPSTDKLDFGDVDEGCGCLVLAATGIYGLAFFVFPVLPQTLAGFFQGLLALYLILALLSAAFMDWHNQGVDKTLASASYAALVRQNAEAQESFDRRKAELEATLRLARERYARSMALKTW